MRNLTATICLTLAVLLGSAGVSYALPQCPSDQKQIYDNCVGTGTDAEGNKYVGEFKNGKIHGQGTYTFADGNKYVGEFRNGKIHGQGTYTYTDGNKYVGEFKNNKPNGQGTFTWASGNKYVGEFRNAKLHGQGTFADASGKIIEGIWKDNKFQYANKTIPKTSLNKERSAAADYDKAAEIVRKARAIAQSEKRLAEEAKRKAAEPKRKVPLSNEERERQKIILSLTIRLDAKKSCGMSATWRDAGSGANLDGYFFNPKLPSKSFFWIGGVGAQDENHIGCVTVVRKSASNPKNTPKLLVPPLDWKLVWKDQGSDADKDGAFWTAVPPSNDFTCLGSIAHLGYEKPNFPNYRCVHKDFVQEVSSSSIIWSDEGSYAYKEVTVLKLPNTGSFIAVKGREKSINWFDLKTDLAVNPDSKTVELALNSYRKKIAEKKRQAAQTKAAAKKKRQSLAAAKRRAEEAERKRKLAAAKVKRKAAAKRRAEEAERKRQLAAAKAKRKAAAKRQSDAKRQVLFKIKNANAASKFLKNFRNFAGLYPKAFDMLTIAKLYGPALQEIQKGSFGQKGSKFSKLLKLVRVNSQFTAYRKKQLLERQLANAKLEKIKKLALEKRKSKSLQILRRNLKTLKSRVLANPFAANASAIAILIENYKNVSKKETVVTLERSVAQLTASMTKLGIVTPEAKAELKQKPSKGKKTLTVKSTANFQKGLDALKRKDYATALRVWKPLAEQGHGRAQNAMGKLYRKGLGVPQDINTAVKWYKLSAKNGDWRGQSSLGAMYHHGRGVPKDAKTAVKWWTLAAKQGDAKAQYNLAVMYNNGTGVPQNDKTAVKWYRLAAEQGFAHAQSFLGQMYSFGRGVIEDDKEAVKWYRLAAEQGHANAQFFLGVMYHNGDGVPQNDKTAVKWHTLAAEQGDAYAQSFLGVMYSVGRGVPQNDKTAVKWYRLAAEQGHAGAQHNLGWKYERGTGVPQNYKTALKWYTLAAKQGDAKIGAWHGLFILPVRYLMPFADTQKSLDRLQKKITKLRELQARAKQGNAKAQYQLGRMYHKGRGAPKDAKTAVKWYRLAAKQGHGDAKRSLDLLNRLEKKKQRDAKRSLDLLNRLEKKKQLAAAGKMVQARCSDGKETRVVHFDIAGGKQDFPELGIPENAEVKFLKNEIVVKFIDGSKKITVSFNLKNGKVLFNGKDGGATCTYSNLSLLKNKSSPGASLNGERKQKPSKGKKTTTAKSSEPVKGYCLAGTKHSHYQTAGKCSTAYEFGNYTAALREWKPLTKQGDAGAQFNLGQMYRRGQGVPEDVKTAVKWYTLAAKQGYAVAQFELAIAYGGGNGVPQNDKTAVKWYTLAAKQGYAAAQYTLGLEFADGGHGLPQDFKTSVKWYTLAAKQGLAAAQYSLGEAYYNGQGVPKDFKTAAKWWKLVARQGDDFWAKKGLNRLKRLQKEKQSSVNSPVFRQRLAAAKKGNAAAQYNLGVMYANGRGVSWDDREAVKWYTLAAKQGHAAAQYNLGWMYFYGRSGKSPPPPNPFYYPQDTVTWMKWASLATQGFKMGVVAAQKGDFASALRVWKPLAISGHADAQYQLAFLYKHGRVVSEDGRVLSGDDKEAAKWYRLAAEQGHTGAQRGLGGYYLTGRGVAKDKKAAVKWYRLAAKQGDAAAKTYLKMLSSLGPLPPDDSVALKKGEDLWLEGDHSRAVAILTPLAKNGYAQAQYILGRLYEPEQYPKPKTDIVRNKKISIKWLRKAANNGHLDSVSILATVYSIGPNAGVIRDLVESRILILKYFELYRKKINFNSGINSNSELDKHTFAMLLSTVADAYEYGYGVAKNYQKAYMWYWLAGAGNARMSMLFKKDKDLLKNRSVLQRRANECRFVKRYLGC